MNWLDIVLLVLIGLSVLTSFRKGFSREVIGLVAVILALLCGIWFYGTAGGFLLPYVNSPAVANFAGFIVMFCGVLLLGSVVSFVAGRFLKVTGLSIFDHALGAGFGAVRGILVAVALITGIMAFSGSEHAPQSVVNSRMAPYVVDAARVVSSMAPYELKEGFRKTYSQVKDAWGKALEDGTAGAKVAHERKI